MKRLACLVILISISGFFCEDSERICSGKVFRRCLQGKSPPGLPETPEELLEVCRTFEDIGYCVIEVRETCEEDEQNLRILSEIRPAVDYVKLTCHEENPTFKTISSNLQCINRVLRSEFGPCRGQMSEKNLELIESHIEHYSENDESGMERCLHHAVDVICGEVTYESVCGEDVKDALTEILSNMQGSRFKFCTPEQLERLEPFLEVAEAIIRDELSL